MELPVCDRCAVVDASGIRLRDNGEAICDACAERLCDTCNALDATTAERDDNGHRQCAACYADALAYGHFHGMHVDDDGQPEHVPGCPTCAGQTPAAYRV